MSFNVKIGRIESPAATGNQSYTGYGFQPKCLLFYTMLNSLNDGSVQSYTRQAVGATSGTANRWACGTAQDDSQATSNTARSFVIDKCIHTTSGSSSVEFSADLVSFNADGFTLNWTTTIASGYEWVVVAFGGTDISIDVDSFNAASGSVAVTGVGFQPTGLMLSYSKNDTTVGEEAEASYVEGWTDGTNKNCSSWVDDDALATSDNSSLVTSSYLLRHINDASTRVSANLTSFDADGFTLNFATASDTPKIGYVAFRGVDIKTGVFTAQTDTNDQTVTGVGFTPSLVLFRGSNCIAEDTETDGVRWFWGMGVSSSEQSTLASYSGDGFDTTHCRKNTRNDDVINYVSFVTSAAAVTGAADMKSLDADGFTIDWTIAMPLASKVYYLAFGVHETSSSSPSKSPSKSPSVSPSPSSAGNNINTLTDNFNDNSFDTGKWTSSLWNSATLAEANQQLEITAPITTQAGSYVTSNTHYSCDGSQQLSKLFL